ncbi:permease (plasmid) [Candidatus Borreliella tachyglossi]|uniref:Permease n=1 Tax=Candidatus Borreliella tachyglossi TaxID=1964448 RepID=A0A2S1LYE7_9SPIR|nr:chromosome replication/partitioning protein [Candidatus Borreliella tachyglossi]AWG43337.1 permease [Candidatus Borreliella tachyglossi]
MKNITLNSRGLNDDKLMVISDKEHLTRYEELKQNIKNNLKKQIFFKLENIRNLKEIRDNKYYKYDGYKSFNQFILDYNFSKTQIYAHLKLADAMETGLIEEQDIIQNGINQCLEVIRNNKNAIKPSKQNPIKPLRFQLKSEVCYAYFKEHIKLASFLLEKIYCSKKEWLEEIIQEFEELRSNK